MATQGTILRTSTTHVAFTGPKGRALVPFHDAELASRFIEVANNAPGCHAELFVLVTIVPSA